MRSAALKSDGKAEDKRQFLTRVRDGVGKEVALAARGSAQGEVRSAVNSVADFIERRSNLRLSGRTKSRLAELGTRSSTGTGRGLTLNELGDIITDAGGNGVIPDVPENIDCSKATFRKDTIAMEESQV